MIVLLVHNPSSDTSRLGAAFQRRGHEVVTVETIAEATVRLKRGLPDVAVVPVSETLVELVDAARPKVGRFCYLMAFLPNDDLALREAAADACLDEVVIGTETDSELLRDVRAAERAVGTSHRLLERVEELERALAGLIASGAGTQANAAGESRSGLLRALLTRTWKNVQDTISRMCGEYLNTAFESGATASPPSSDCRGARIALNDVADNLEIAIVVFAAESSMRALATAFCGGDESLVDDAIMQDVLFELSNSCMSAVKNDFLAEGFQFTAGVPQPVALNDVALGMSKNDAYRLISSSAKDISVGFMLTLSHKAKVRILGKHLKEGMVVASDVFSDNGLLLVKAGTRLTETTAERLARFVPKKLISQLPPDGP